MKPDDLSQLFFIASAIYFVGQACTFAVNGKISCDRLDNGADDDIANTQCQGYSISAGAMLIGAILCILAATFKENAKAFQGLFCVGLTCLSLGFGASYASDAYPYCENDEVTDDTFCSSNSTAAVSYTVSALAFFIASILLAAGKPYPGQAIVFIGFAFFSGGFFCSASGFSDYACEAETQFEGTAYEEYFSRLCIGITGSTIAGGVSFSLGIIGAVIVNASLADIISYKWFSWFMYVSCLMLSWAAYYAAFGAASCYAYDNNFDDDGNNESKYNCEAFEVAAGFAGLASVLVIIGMALAGFNFYKFRNFIFFLSLAALMASFGTEQGVSGRNQCAMMEDDDSAGNGVDDDVVAAQCQGYSTASAILLLSSLTFGVGALVSLVTDEESE